MSTASLRDIHTRLILSALLKEGSLSRADLAKKLSLTKATISSIVQDLLDRELLIEETPSEAAVGRRPTPLTFRADAGVILSVNLDTYTVSASLSDLNGGSCLVREIANTFDGDSILPPLTALLEELLKEAPQTPYGLVGISLGIHGVVHRGAIIFTPYRSYEKTDFAAALADTFHVPVLLENEANLSALGEYTYCYPTKDIINISVHSGIGLGLILNGRLYTGHGGYAGEFGHTILIPDGRPCPCGNRGCLEQYASERAILLDTGSSLAGRIGQSSVSGSIVRRTVSGGVQVPLSGDDFSRLYLSGDPDALRGMDQFVKYLGIGINNIMNTFNPEIIVINSRFTMNHPELIDRLKDQLTNRMRDTVTIVPSGLTDMAILLGGVVSVRNRFLGI